MTPVSKPPAAPVESPRVVSCRKCGGDAQATEWRNPDDLGNRQYLCRPCGSVSYLKSRPE